MDTLLYMVLLSLFYVLLLSLVFYFIYKFYKAKKNIWQKISFLYNKLYSLLILDYYQNWTDNQALKKEMIEEIDAFYTNIVLNSNLWIKIQNWNNIKSFMLEYLNNDELVDNIYKKIDLYGWKTYKNLEKSINNLVLSIIVIIITVIILFKNI